MPTIKNWFKEFLETLHYEVLKIYLILLKIKKGSCPEISESLQLMHSKVLGDNALHSELNL